MLISILRPNLIFPPMMQPSNVAIKYNLLRSSKPKVKPTLDCHSNIAITIPYISGFVSYRYSKHRCSYGRLSVKGTWLPCGFDLWKVLFLEISLSCITMRYHYDICIFTQDICLTTCSRGHPLLNMNRESNIQSCVAVTLIASSWSKWFLFT